MRIQWWLLWCLPWLATARELNVLDFGAIGDGKTADTSAIRAAIRAAAGGGSLRFPGGHSFLTGPLNISSHTELYLEPGSTLLADAAEPWPLVDPGQVWPQYGNGGDCFPLTDPSCSGSMHQPFLFSWSTQNVTVRGEGTIDGQSGQWWGCAGSDCPHVPNCTRPPCPHCPKPEAPCNGVSRPHLVMMANVTSTLFAGVTIQNSPDWTLHFSSCTDVHVDGVTIYNPHGAPNGDGIDIDSTQRVLVENCRIDVNDDSLCVKSGMDGRGRAYARPSRDILFRNNFLGRGGGMTIGSEGSGGVFNVTYQDITLNGTSLGVHIKSRPTRGGTMDGIYYRNIRGHNLYGGAMSISLGGGPDVPETRPRLFNVVIQNATFTADATVSQRKDLYGTIMGNPWEEIVNVTLRDVRMDFLSNWGPIGSVSNGRCEGNVPSCPFHSLFQSGSNGYSRRS